MTTFLITGGAGSLGRALIDHIDSNNIIRVLDNNEYGLSLIKNKNVRKLYGDVSDVERVRKAVKGVDVVIHAAAMKNIEITEYNISELVKTNITGTDNVISASVDANVNRVMFISSDKAVEPINSYGASKLIGENIALNYGLTQHHTLISVYRPCNFYDARGNALEIWKEQMKKGEPVTITDFDCIRFFIKTNTVTESILKSIEVMTGNELFVPSTPIIKCESVRSLIDSLDWDCNNIIYNIIGLRKGEKMYEKMMTEDETNKSSIDSYTGCYIIKKR